MTAFNRGGERLLFRVLGRFEKTGESKSFISIDEIMNHLSYHDMFENRHILYGSVVV